MPRQRSRARSRRLVGALVVLFVVGALGAGAWYLIRRGRGSSDPFRRALHAQQAGDMASAESQARAILEEEPDHAGARALLIQVLASARRFDEAESLAQYWQDRPDDEVLGLRARSQLALQRGDADKAVRLARLVADRDPAFSQAMLMQVQDLRGTPVDREGAVRAAESLGRLSHAPSVRAAAFLFAAETLRDLEREAATAARRHELAQRREIDRREARGAALTPMGPGGSADLSPADAKALMGRIQLLSPEEAEQLKGRETLEALLEAEPAQHAARASLIAYYLGASMAAKAVAEAEHLTDAPALIALRTVGALAAAGEVTTALEVLDALTSVPEAARTLMRARILTSGSDVQREEGLASLQALAKAEPDNLTLAEEVFSRLVTLGDIDRAIAFLEDVAKANPRLRVTALRERSARALATGQREQLHGFLEQLAAIVTLDELPGLFTRLQGAGGPADASAVELLDRVLAAGHVDAAEVRLLRAAVTSARPGAAPDGRSWAEHAREDLETIATSAGVSASLLVRAAQGALAADERDLIGVLLGRALSAAQGGTQALELYLRLVGDKDATLRQLVSQGMRAGALAEPGRSAWIGALADALLSGDATVLRRASGDAAPAAAQAPVDTDTALQLLLAARAKDWPEAEAYARQRIAAAGAKDRDLAVMHLGAVLLDAGKLEAVLSLHEGNAMPASHREQRVLALDRLGRFAEATREARTLVAETGGSNRALVVLAQVLSKRDPDAALAAAAAAPGSLEGAFLRADLLERRGDEEAALVLFEDLLRASQNRNMAAWQGLGRVLTAAGRGSELIQHLTTAIGELPATARSQDVAALFLMRGQALEGERGFESAFADYKRVLELVKDHPVALNNAAWLMSAGLVRSTVSDPVAWREQALEMVGRAVRAAPGLAPLYHTQAKILMALERNQEALESMDRAIEIYSAQPVPEGTDPRSSARAAAARARLGSYLLDKAHLLAAMGRADAARGLFREIVEAFPGSYPAAEAQKALGD